MTAAQPCIRSCAALIRHLADATGHFAQDTARFARILIGIANGSYVRIFSVARVLIPRAPGSASLCHKVSDIGVSDHQQNIWQFYRPAAMRTLAEIQTDIRTLGDRDTSSPKSQGYPVRFSQQG